MLRTRDTVFKWLIKLGFVMDALRVWPRLFVSAYLIGMMRMLDWYFHQDVKAWESSAFASVYAGLCIPLLKWYMENGVDWSQWLPMIVKSKKPKEQAPCGSSK
jgi:hypothetical protein